MSDIYLDLGKAGVSKPCESRIAADCLQRFISPDGNQRSCSRCAQVEVRIADNADRPHEEITPDDHPTTGYLDILTPEEKERLDLATRWV